MSHPINVLMFDPRDNSFTRAQVNKYQDYYPLLTLDELIPVNTFDIVNIADDIDIYVDDEGLFKETLYVTEMVDDYARTFQLVGKLVFTGGPDNEGNTTSITKTEQEIRKHILRVFVGVQK